MILYWIGLVYGFIGSWIFRGTYRNGRQQSPQRPAWREVLECGIGALLWPVTFVLIFLVIVVLWLGFRGDSR
jgi:hypothetical protein